MNGIIGNIFLGFIRHMVSAAFGGMLAHGLITQSQDEQSIGAVMVLITVGFSAYDKIQAKSASAANQGNNDDKG
jgi:hypothetical protein